MRSEVYLKRLAYFFQILSQKPLEKFTWTTRQVSEKILPKKVSNR